MHLYTIFCTLWSAIIHKLAEESLTFHVKEKHYLFQTSFKFCWMLLGLKITPVWAVLDLLSLTWQRLQNADKTSVVYVLPQCSWPAVTASPSTAWPVYASSSSPLLRKSTTFLWLTPAITCWTCPATRPKRPYGTGSHKPWSSTKDSVWSEQELRRWLSVCWHCTLNLWRNGNERCSRIYFTTEEHVQNLMRVNL